MIKGISVVAVRSSHREGGYHVTITSIRDGASAGETFAHLATREQVASVLAAGRRKAEGLGVDFHGEDRTAE